MPSSHAAADPLTGGPGTSGGGPGRASALYRAASAIEDVTWLDRPAGVLHRVLPAALVKGPVRDALGGRWLGHALHPMLTDFPLGSWMAASLLDVLPGADHDEASQRLLGFGLLMAVPTIAAGWSDWLHAEARERRVGIVHATVNTAAASLYAGSLVARRSRRRGLGVALGITGGLVAIAGGFLGGHLSLARDTALRTTAGVVL